MKSPASQVERVKYVKHEGGMTHKAEQMIKMDAPPLCASATVHMDSPPERHSRPQNRLHCHGYPSSRFQEGLNRSYCWPFLIKLLNLRLLCCLSSTDCTFPCNLHIQVRQGYLENQVKGAAQNIFWNCNVYTELSRLINKTFFKVYLMQL